MCNFVIAHHDFLVLSKSILWVNHETTIKFEVERINAHNLGTNCIIQNSKKYSFGNYIGWSESSSHQIGSKFCSKL